MGMGEGGVERKRVEGGWWRGLICEFGIRGLGRWEMGNGRWEMGDGRWEMGDGRAF